MQNHTSQKGFTLVELSIVLVIISLLVGGILLGRNLIRAAELRHITTELHQLQQAVGAFQLRYGGLPGDLVNATDYFGERAGGSCAAPSLTDKGVCNGDGDGLISRKNYVENCGAGAWTTLEQVQFWQHLGRSGLIEGEYSGSMGNAAIPAEPGFSSMASRMGKNIVWDAMHISECNWWAWGGPNNLAREEQGNGLMVGSFNTSSLTGGPPRVMPTAEFVTPTEAYSIDRKIDDGMPGTGKMRVLVTQMHNGTIFTWCANANSTAAALTARYNLNPAAGVTPLCAIYFPHAL